MSVAFEEAPMKPPKMFRFIASSFLSRSFHYFGVKDEAVGLRGSKRGVEEKLSHQLQAQPGTLSGGRQSRHQTQARLPSWVLDRRVLDSERNEPVPSGRTIDSICGP